VLMCPPPPPVLPHSHCRTLPSSHVSPYAPVSAHVSSQTRVDSRSERFCNKQRWRLTRNSGSCILGEHAGPGLSPPLCVRPPCAGFVYPLRCDVRVPGCWGRCFAEEASASHRQPFRHLLWVPPAPSQWTRRVFTWRSSTGVGCPDSPYGPLWFRWPRAVAERGGLELWSGVSSLGGFSMDDVSASCL
jgi:hypothetical protein